MWSALDVCGLEPNPLREVTMRSAGYLLVIVCTFLVGCWIRTSAAQLQRIHSHPTDGWFLDDLGRVRFFHGVNAVIKEFPWYPEWLLEDHENGISMLDDLADWGMNVVRLGSMWSGAEPLEGQYNATYFDVLHQIIQNLEARGVYVMLDMHQDCLNALYDGIPGWLEDTFPAPNHPWPWPLQEVSFWEQNYLTQEVSAGMQDFWDNYNGAIDRWGDFWAEMARHYKDYPSVLGYNLINEPWIGDYFTDPSLALPGIAGRTNHLPAYDAVNEKIREVDPNGIMFYEPTFYGQAGQGDFLGSGFDRVPGGEQYRNVSSYSFHMYCWALEFIDPGAPDEDRLVAKEFCDNQLLPLMINSAEKNWKLTGGTAILTEFGLCRTWQDEVNVDCETYLDLSDDHLMSWVEWGYPWEWYQNGVNGGAYTWGKIDAYLRTYAQAVAGIPSVMKFNQTTYSFDLIYQADPSISSPTEIYVPARKHPNGYQYVITPLLPHTAHPDRLHVYNSDLTEVTEVTVSITPRGN